LTLRNSDGGGWRGADLKISTCDGVKIFGGTHNGGNHSTRVCLPIDHIIEFSQGEEPGPSFTLYRDGEEVQTAHAPFFEHHCGTMPTTGGPADTTRIVKVEVKTDDYPGENSWTLQVEGGGMLKEKGPFSSKRTEYTETIEVQSGTKLIFSMKDSYSDGMCCSYGRGSYKVTCADRLVKEGGQFGQEEKTTFTCE